MLCLHGGGGVGIADEAELLLSGHMMGCEPGGSIFTAAWALAKCLLHQQSDGQAFGAGTAVLSVARI